MHQRASLLVGMPHVLWLAALALLPLFLIVMTSLAPPLWAEAQGHSLGSYARLFEKPYPQVAANSLLVSAITSFTCILLCLPAALAIVRLPSRWHSPLLLASCLPFWVSALVRVYALQEILGKNGVVNGALELVWQVGALLVPGMGEFEPVRLLFTSTAVVAGLTYAFLPFALLPIYASLSRIDQRLLDASADLGAPWRTTLSRVILPLAAPGIAIAFALVFIPCLGAFYIPEMLGGPGDLLLGSLIKFQFLEANNWPYGSAASATLVLLAVALVFAPLLHYRRRLS